MGYVYKTLLFVYVLQLVSCLACRFVCLSL